MTTLETDENGRVYIYVTWMGYSGEFIHLHKTEQGARDCKCGFITRVDITDID